MMSIVLRDEAEDVPINRYGLMKNLNVHHVITRGEATWLVILYVIDGLSLMGIVLRIEAEDLPVNRYELMKNLNVHHVITRSEATW